MGFTSPRPYTYAIRAPSASRDATRILGANSAPLDVSKDAYWTIRRHVIWKYCRLLGEVEGRGKERSFCCAFTEQNIT